MHIPCWRFSRIIAAALMSLFAVTASAQGLLAYPPQVDNQRQRPQPPTPEPSREHHSDNWVPWAIAGVIGVAAIAAATHKAGAAVPTDSLLESGPRFPDSYTPGTFAVQGYVGSAWPVVIDFLPQPDTCTTLDISVDNKLEWGTILDPDGRSGRQLLKVMAPERKKGQAAAIYVIHSRTPACGQPGEQQLARVQIYGIGAGPRAVGSVAIENLQFGPPRPRFPTERAGIEYDAKSPFNHTSIEILRFDEKTPGVINVERVRSSRTDAVLVGSNSADPWDGTTQGGTRSIGVHRLEVRGWFTENDRSWVGAISPMSVDVAP
jgi:hypothetical protein